MHLYVDFQIKKGTSYTLNFGIYYSAVLNVHISNAK